MMQEALETAALRVRGQRMVGRRGSCCGCTMLMRPLVAADALP